MTQYIDKEALVAELERLYNLEYDDTSNLSCGKKIMLRHILLFLDTLELKEVDLEKEIQDHIRECLDVKFPTTNIELIQKDVAYTAKKIFELGLKAKEKVTTTDAFIEKACEWLEPVLKDLAGYNCAGDLIKDFKQTMKGE